MSTRSPLPTSESLAFVEALYADWLRDRRLVSAEWQTYFEKEYGEERNGKGQSLGPSFKPSSLFNPPGAVSRSERDELASIADRVNRMIRIYRMRGHMVARIDPLDRPRPRPPELELDFYGFTEGELKQELTCEALPDNEKRSILEIVELLRDTYCRSIGVQFMHIDEIHVRHWLERRMESTRNRLELAREEQLWILKRLIDAVTFEEFLHKKFIGAKSFSLDGCESLIPLLNLAIETAGDQGCREIVLGMAHRGRLNVLANIMGKNPRDIFREFADKDHDLFIGRGDVKYHLGYSYNWKTAKGAKVHLSLCFNPSHLEFVNPVALGRVRAKQDRVGDTHLEKCMALLIHGDASFAGQGVIQETLNLSQLPGYATGGTLHVVVNNQIGFTTSPAEGRSSTYATAIAKMLQIPIFHVNGEDPEAVAQVVKLGMEFLKTFKRDVVIDMYGYRRLGHNETDEPAFTQPVLYRAISERKSVLEGYLDHLLQLKGITREEADELTQQRHEKLDKHLSDAHREDYKRPREKLRGIWKRTSYVGGEEVEETQTAVDKQRLSDMLEALCEYPEDFTPHPKIQKFLEVRRKMARGKKPVDWSAAEALAFGTVALEGYRVRLSGQDSRRGTFSHRHAVLYDYEDGLTWIPLQNLAPDQAPVDIYNSPLSETGVLGFDYGYSLDFPDGLILWEAQFGDFVNSAQVIVDQFISSAEDKWNRLSGLVMLLPHGFEGMGPEHSSARLERFLTLAAENNLQVVQPTTPAQFFHVLRRQVLSRWRKPLVVMSPKSLLRHPQVISSLEDLSEGGFRRLLPGQLDLDRGQVRRILLCSGKVYYELEKEREKRGIDDVAILRLEQLYPLRDETLEEGLKGFAKSTPICWVQEEPENMGAWRYLRLRLGEKVLGRHPLRRISRPESSSPATGSAQAHKQEQQSLMNQSFEIGKGGK